MVNLVSYYLLIRIRSICKKFNISISNKKILYIFLFSSFTVITAVLSVFNYSILKLALYYNKYNINLNSITKFLYIAIIIYLTFNGISSTYSKVFCEKDYNFIENFKKNKNKIFLCKYISEIFMKNIYLSSIVYISINIAIFIEFKKEYKSIFSLLIYYVIYTILPIIYKYLIILLIHSFKKSFDILFAIKVIITNTFVIIFSYFVSNVIINWKNVYSIYIYNQFEKLTLYTSIFFVLSMVIMAALIFILKNKKKSNINKVNNKLLDKLVIKFNNKFVYYQYIILKREKDTYRLLFESISFCSCIILGIVLNLGEEIVLEKLKMIMFFSMIFSFELSESILKKVLSIENDKLIIRYLINRDYLIDFFKSKIKVYFFMYAINNLILILPVIILGKLTDSIGLTVTICIFSLIYSFNSLITNIVKPNFELLKNEELQSTLINDIINALLKVANITIYYSLGLYLFVYTYLNKINVNMFWGILIITMVSHLGILYLFLKKLLTKKIWTRWEGI